MKKLVVGVIGLIVFFGNVAVASNKVYTIKSPTLICYKESDAIPAQIALGVGNKKVVMSFINNDECLFVNNKIKIKILSTKKFKAPKGIIPIHKVQVVEVNGEKWTGTGKVPDMWMSDIMEEYK